MILRHIPHLALNTGSNDGIITMTDIHFGNSTQSLSLFDRLQNWAVDYRRRARRTHLRQATDRSLRNLGDALLSDIGINRSQLAPSDRFSAMEPTNPEMRRARF